jgi:hypothetical protein
MEMKLANKESKSILAKLLASENLTVEHGKFNTASFDTKNRVLRLPIWKEMNGSLYDLLVLHEVGHALFTPEEGLHDAKDHGKGFKSFLNVVEDARIERKIKIKYPGGRRSFVTGYDDLMKRDFFGIKGTDVDELNLIDRINLHYKIGTHRNISFSGEESVFIDRIDKAQTWKEVVKICEDLYEYAKENESETDMSDHEWENVMADGDEEDEDWDENYDPSDFDCSNEDEEDGEEGESGDGAGEDVEDDVTDESKEKREASEESTEEDETEEGKSGGSGEEGGMDGKFEPESKTDSNFRNNEIELVSEEAKDYVYLNLPTKIDMKNVVVNFSDVYEEYREMYSSTSEPRYSNEITGAEMLDAATKLFKDFRNKNKKIVEYLAKEFEMKKAAKEHARTATANSGILDSERLYTYKYNEHIFKKLSITPDGKNHGLVMFVDWSGSMSRNMKGTIDQLMILVMFCKRVNIPFEVYAFSDSYTRYKDDLDYVDSNGHILSTKTPDYGDVVINRFNLLNLFSSRMRSKELHEAYIFMTATASYYSNAYRYYGEGVYFSIPDRMNLGGTPLNSTLLVSFSIMREFQKKNQVDVINSIFLTDGDSHSSNNYWTENGTNVEHFDVRKQNVILRDPVSKKTMLVDSKHDFRQASSFTEALVRFQRDVFNINIVNFFLIDRMKKYEMQHHLDKQRKSRGETDSIPEWEEVHNAMKEWRKNKYMIAPEMMGFNEQYLVQGGKALEVEETILEVAEDATVAQMAKAFKKFSSGKLEKRKLLSRFINMVAA